MYIRSYILALCLMSILAGCVLADDSALGCSDVRIPYPSCWLDSWLQTCSANPPFTFHCEIVAIFKRYDIYGRPYALTASAENACVVKHYLFGYVGDSCTASDSASGSGIISLDADCYMTFGTDYGVCFTDPSYHCRDW